MDTGAVNDAVAEDAARSSDQAASGTTSGMPSRVDLTETVNNATSIYFWQKLACANPNCPFLASSDRLDGGYCCSRCYWRSVAPSSANKNKRHTAGCAKAYPEQSGGARAPPDPPAEAILCGAQSESSSKCRNEPVGVADAVTEVTQATQDLTSSSVQPPDTVPNDLQGL